MKNTRFNKLLQRAKYDESSFDELYKFYYYRIIRHLEVRFGYALAEDSAQEFFMSIIDVSKTFGHVEYPTAWVYKCCENIAKRKIACDSKYSLCGDNIESQYNIDLTLARVEQTDEVKNLLKDFDGDTKKIIYLVYWEGYNLKETSQILNISYAAVRQKYSRAIKKLKKLSQNGD